MLQKIQLSGLFLLFTLTLAAQSNKTEGIIEKLTDEVIYLSHLTGTNHPNEGEKVTIDKKFQNGAFSGTHSLAEGTVTKCTAHEMYIKVSKYTSTVVDNGKKRPMAKVNDHAIVKWEGKSQQLNESHTDSKEDLVRLQTVINDAQKLIKKRKYKEAVALLKPEITKYHDCYACHFVLGHAFYEMREEEKAIYQMTTVINVQAEKYPMAYVWRARAYADNYPHQYKEAIADYRLVVDKYAKKSSTKVVLLKEIIEIHDKLKDHEAACKTVKEVQALNGKNPDNMDLYNHYCLGIEVPKKKHIRFDGVVTKQSDDMQTFTVQIAEEAEDCYYSKYFGEPEYEKITNLKEGDMLEVSTCSPKGKMGIAIAKVTAINGQEAQMEVLYWTNKINGHPWRRKFKADKPFTFAW